MPFGAQGFNTRSCVRNLRRNFARKLQMCTFIHFFRSLVAENRLVLSCIVLYCIVLYARSACGEIVVRLDNVFVGHDRTYVP